MGNKALFLDRDGIINEDTAYLYKPDQVVFCTGIFGLCYRAQLLDYKIIVITNQSGIARGYFTEDDVKHLHSWIMDQLAIKGIIISAFYYCPYHPKAKIKHYKRNSFDRKPNPGMILKAAKEHAIDLSRSLFIGDKPTDRIKHPKLKSIIVRSKYSEDDYDVSNLSEILKFL